MAKTRQQKEEEVKQIAAKLKEAKSVVFAGSSGLTVMETEKLRNDLRKKGGEIKVAKKRLLKIALKQEGLDETAADNLKGNVTLAFGMEDEVAPAKVLFDLAKDGETLELFGGLLENNYIDGTRVKSLATLPSKEELIAKTVGTIKAPLSGLANVLAGNIRNLVYVLSAIKDNKN